MTFTPAPWARGPHLQTIIPTFYPVFGPEPASRILDVPVAPETKVRTLVSVGAGKGTIVLIHGLGGCASGVYMLRTARAALVRGWSVVRMNLRNCGGTERMAKTLYNAGQSDDLARVLEAMSEARLPRPFAVIGFSLGGNLALRYAGVAEDASMADAVVGVNPPVDLARCMDALERPANRPYHFYFRAKLIAQIRAIRKVREVPGPEVSWRTVRGVRGFDDVFTAPDAGLADSAAYYRHASSGPILDRIRRPTLILSAADDPFVPVSMFPAWNGSASHLRFLHPKTGGHCGYWASSSPRYWAAEAALQFLDSPENRP
ncbi:MAG TPA: alpha/beta fold hydrolase [Candidatus Polarisedimenticolaceae bacterium]|nr:alpha/beta fold hydrolase [Candidatus Polarisedimenticolaceae bacterium]